MTEVTELEPGKTYDVTVRGVGEAVRSPLIRQLTIGNLGYLRLERIVSAVEVVEEPPVGSIVRDGEGDLLVRLSSGRWTYVTLDGRPCQAFASDIDWSEVNNAHDVPQPVTIIHPTGRDDD